MFYICSIYYNKLGSKNKKIEVKVEEKVVKLYLKGYNYPKIALYFNIDKSTVCKILKRKNVQLRSRSESQTKYKVNHNFFEKIDSESKAYFLGLLMADGCNTRKGFRIMLQKKDEQIIKKLKKELEFTGKLFYQKFRSGKKYHGDGVMLNVCSQKISDDLSKFGVVPNKSHVTYFPNQIPKELEHHFIRGIFDGDGHISKYFSIVGNDLLLNKISEKFKEKCLSLNLIFNKTTSKRKNIVSLRCNVKNDIIIIRDYLYYSSTIFIKRKHKKFYLITKKSIKNESSSKKRECFNNQSCFA